MVPTPDTAPTTTQQSKPTAANPRVLKRTERLLEEGPAAVGVALKICPVPTEICPASTEIYPVSTWTEVSNGLRMVARA